MKHRNVVFRAWLQMESERKAQQVEVIQRRISRADNTGLRLKVDDLMASNHYYYKIIIVYIRLLLQESTYGPQPFTFAFGNG